MSRSGRRPAARLPGASPPRRAERGSHTRATLGKLEHDPSSPRRLLTERASGIASVAPCADPAPASCGEGADRASSQSRTYSPSASSQRPAASSAGANPAGAAGAAGAAGGPAGEPGAAAGSDDDVVDAEIVDEDTDKR